MLQTYLNTVLAPMFYARVGYRGYRFEPDRDSAGVPFVRIRTPLGDACGYAVTPRAAVVMLWTILAVEKETGHLPPSGALYGPDTQGNLRLDASYFNPERRS
jgi:hypothetical protein